MLQLFISPDHAYQSFSSQKVAKKRITQTTLVPVFIVPGSAIVPFVSSISTGCTQPRHSIICIGLVDIQNDQVEDKIILFFAVNAPQRPTKRRTLAPEKIIKNLKIKHLSPANLNVTVTRSTVVHIKVAMIIKKLPTGFTRSWKLNASDFNWSEGDAWVFKSLQYMILKGFQDMYDFSKNIWKVWRRYIVERFKQLVLLEDYVI